MSQLKFMKIGATVSAAIAKETVLSKLINMIHVFRIDVANKPFDDVQRKYIDTILKLDDSKTIILETKGEEITLKNMKSISYASGDEFTMEYSQIQEDDTSSIFVNYSYLSQIPIGATIGFEWSELSADVIAQNDGVVRCRVKIAWTLSMGQKMLFFGYKPKLSFLSEKDKKDVIRGIQSWVNLLAASSVKNAEDVLDMKNFLLHNNGEGIKIYTRLHAFDVLPHLESVIAVSDGIVLTHNDIQWANGEHTMQSLISLVKQHGKPIMICLTDESMRDEQQLSKDLYNYTTWGVDIVMVGDDITEKWSPVDPIQYLTGVLQQAEQETSMVPQYDRFTYTINNEIEESNYVISLLPRIIQDIDAKVVICYTGSGYTSAKIASLKLAIPSLIFTKNDAVYRYNNLLRWVKWYKIWQTSNYNQLKQIGKEMIRIHFKGNISLDDKVIIVSLIESEEDSKIEWVINGIEVYKFKNI